MIFNTQTDLILNIDKKGYIAGTVTVQAVKKSRHLWLFDVNTYKKLRHTVSLSNGHYAFFNLDASKKYLVMCFDLPPSATEQRYEPFAWHHVAPATDLTIEQQQQQWQGWVDSTG